MAMGGATLAQALECEVAAIRALEAALRATGSRGGRYSLSIDRHFARLLDLLRPRIAWLTRRYGLSGMREDAEQACAIGIHRAVQEWDPDMARFVTLAYWQMRGELQSLRHRMMLDQRQSARSAGMRTISMIGPNGRERAEVAALEDNQAQLSAESGASDAMVRSLIERLMAQINSPREERALVLETLFARDPPDGLDRKASEQRRQIVRRTFRNCGKIAAAS